MEPRFEPSIGKPRLLLLFQKHLEMIFTFNDKLEPLFFNVLWGFFACSVDLPMKASQSVQEFIQSVLGLIPSHGCMNPYKNILNSIFRLVLPIFDPGHEFGDLAIAKTLIASHFDFLKE